MTVRTRENEEVSRQFLPQDDEFIRLVKCSIFTTQLKDVVIRLITNAIEMRIRTTPTTSASVLLGMTGFYVFNNPNDAKSFVTVRQKVLSFDGTALTYGNVKMMEKFPYSLEMFEACKNTSQGIYVELIPIVPAEINTANGKRISNMCPTFCGPVFKNKTVVRTAEKRNVFRYLDSRHVFDELGTVNEDANGFGVTRMMICKFCTVVSQKDKMNRTLELVLGLNVNGKYVNYIKNAEVSDEDLNADENLLVFVNPTLAPNSKPGPYVTLFTTGYSGIYGKKSHVFAVVPKDAFTQFKQETENQEHININHEIEFQNVEGMF